MQELWIKHGLVLAQSRQSPPTELWLWVGALIIASLVFGVVVLAMRRRLFNASDVSVSPGSMLDQLRAMRERGEISRAEYDSARASIAARAAGKAPPPRPNAERGPVAPDGSVAAKPGFDLTGERLPGRHEPGPEPESSEESAPPKPGEDPAG